MVHRASPGGSPIQFLLGFLLKEFLGSTFSDLLGLSLGEVGLSPLLRFLSGLALRRTFSDLLGLSLREAKLYLREAGLRGRARVGQKTFSQSKVFFEP